MTLLILSSCTHAIGISYVLHIFKQVYTKNLILVIGVRRIQRYTPPWHCRGLAYKTISSFFPLGLLDFIFFFTVIYLKFFFLKWEFIIFFPPEMILSKGIYTTEHVKRRRIGPDYKPVLCTSLPVHNSHMPKNVYVSLDYLLCTVHHVTCHSIYKEL